MAEVKPASDALLNKQEQLANSNIHYCHSTDMRRILARLRKAEADLARLHAAIDEAEKHGPEVVHFIRAMATQGGGNG